MPTSTKLQLLIDLRTNLSTGLNKARNQVNKAVGGMQDKLNAFGIRNSQIFEGISSQVPGLSGVIGSLANPYTLAASAIAATAAAIWKATMAANDWHAQMAQVNVTAGLSKDKLSELSDQLLEIGGRNAAPLEEVPKAFNKIISAGLSVDQSLATLEPTLRAAKAGFTDLETTAGAATSVMMSAGVDATKAFDVLFATQKAGNAEFKDIANYLPKVIPLARNVGFALDETAGAFASLTGSLKPEAASTALEGMMRAMSDAKVVNNFKGLNIDIFDKSTGQARPLLDIIGDINKSMSGLTDKQKMLKFDKLGLDQSATLGFSTLMQNMPKVSADIDAVINSQGSLNKAYEDGKTPLESWNILQNQLKVEMIKIGELFLPILTAIGERILGVIQYWKDLYNSSVMFRDLLSGLGLIFESVFYLMTAAHRAIWNAGVLSYKIYTSIVGVMGEWIGKITGVKGGFKDLYTSVKPYLIFIKNLLMEVGGLLYDVFTLNFEGAYDRMNNFKMPEISAIRERVNAERNTNNETTGDFAGIPIATTDTSTGAGTGKGLGAGAANDMKGIKGGSQTKNITINIDSFIKNLSPTNQSFNGLSMEEIEKRFTEMFMRVVRSAETGF